MIMPMTNGTSKYKGTKSLDAVINTSPHYTDRLYKNERTEFCSEPEKLIDINGTLMIDGIHYDYSDRLFEWDSKKMRASFESADTSLSVSSSDWQKRATARYIRDVLRFYYDDPELEIVHIVAGVNHGNGYPYLVYGTRRSIGETNE